jgi:hypothetical protein
MLDVILTLLRSLVTTVRGRRNLVVSGEKILPGEARTLWPSLPSWASASANRRCVNISLGFENRLRKLGRHFWGRTRKGRWAVRQQTARSRLTRVVFKIHTWCRFSRHKPVAEQQQTLNRKLQGHYSYYSIIGNADALQRFFNEVRNTWRKWLNRRGGRRPADIHLALKPGTDALLTRAMIAIILQQGWENRGYLEKM